MSPERWQKVERLYHQALERNPEQRVAFLADKSEGDEELFDEVRSLLDPHSTDSRLDHPVWELSRDSAAPRLTPGAQLGPYTIEAALGAGGMGEVFRAWDTRLSRTVAIKLPKRRFTEGFQSEAQAVAALNHPNIVQVYDLQSEGDFIVMEYVRGATLLTLLRAAKLRIEDALEYAYQIASALAAAHAAGIVHRDIKPGNIMITDSGVIKILDFGLAQMEQDPRAIAAPLTAGGRRDSDVILGTAAYMSPEQVEGKAMYAHSDIFSTGALFYEMFTGARAFGGDSMLGVFSKVLHQSPAGIRELRPEAPEWMERIIRRCLEKDPDLRYASAKELAGELQMHCRPGRVRISVRARALIAVALMCASAFSGWLTYRNWRGQWTRDEALPQIRKLIGKGDYLAAFDLTHIALRYDPDDPQLKQHWSELSIPLNLTSTPEGAKVLYKAYGEASSQWRSVGNTPLKNVRVPAYFMQIRLEKEGFQAVEFATHGVVLLGQSIPLPRAGDVPTGMLAVPERPSWVGPIDVMPLPAYFLDKFEVTNRQFKEFIEAGGYQDSRYWKYPFVGQAGELNWDEAVTRLRDVSGRPGPSGWAQGSFPKDQADFPVSGVSWFEAAAYCEFRGKALPTVHHWRKVATFSIFSEILLFSNFSGKGPAPAGSHPGVSGLGAYDMAGNVKEWCWNSSGGKTRDSWGRVE